MFDGLFKPKFYTKCKSLVKLTKTRVVAVKRKKDVVCKYLKNDIADLLKNHRDYSAYGRIEGLLEEKKRMRCYELLDQFCSCVGTNVSLLYKTTGCPEACREAIASLVYAAARVSEVPELRDLRQLFAARYGSSLEQFVSQELVETFKVESPSTEMKLQLMHEIAGEYAVEWNSKSLEQKLHKPAPVDHALHDDGNQQVSGEDANFEDRQTRAKTKEETLEDKANSLTLTFVNSKTSANEQVGVGAAAKPRSVRRRLAKPPPDADDDDDNQRRVLRLSDISEESLYPLKPPPGSRLSLREDSMEKAGSRRFSRRTVSLQMVASDEGRGRHFELPDFDEVAARVDAIRRE